MVTKANLDQLGLPPAEAQKLLARAAGAPKKATRRRRSAEADPGREVGPRATRHSPGNARRLVRPGPRRPRPPQERHRARSGRQGRQGPQVAPDRRTGADRPGVEAGRWPRRRRAGNDRHRRRRSITGRTIRELVEQAQRHRQADAEPADARERSRLYNAKRAAVLEQIVAEGRPPRSRKSG